MPDDTQSFSFLSFIRDLDPAMLKMLRSDLGSGSSLEIQHALNFDAVKHFIPREGLSLLGSGEVFAAENQSSSFDRLVANLNMTTTALIHFAPEYTLLLYPPDQHNFEKHFDWAASRQRDAVLHMKILKPLSVPAGVVSKTTKQQIHSAPDEIKQINLKADELFHWHSPPALQPRVLLVFPKDRHAIQERLTRDLQALGAVVYQATKAGALSYFRKQIKEKDDGGAIIVSQAMP